MKQFKNSLSVTGSKSLLKAFSEELEIIGYKKEKTSGDFNWIKNPSHLLTNFDRAEDCFGFHNHSGGIPDKINLTLPSDWSRALELAAEEVKEEFKVGDWIVSLTDRPTYRKKGDVFKIYDISDRCIYYTSNTNGDCSEFRLATPSEIEKFLIGEAEKKGFVKGAKVRKKADNSIHTIHKLSYGYIGNGRCSSDKVQVHYGICVMDIDYFELLPSTPQIEKCGYKAKFETWGLNFNDCAHFDKEIFITLAKVLNLESNYTNRGLHSVKLGKADFTAKEIIEIANHFNEKP